MKSSNVPGYKDLFGDSSESYHDLVDNISSEIIIRVCSALNNELNGVGGMAGNQLKILSNFALTFTEDQRKDLSRRLGEYQQIIGKDNNVILFGTRYLMSMVLKELNNNRIAEINLNAPAVEYQLFKAYLLIVDEVAASDNAAIDFKALPAGDPQNLLRLMWLPMISQFEFNEHSNFLFETYKTLCFFKYLQNSEYFQYFKEYLFSLNFKSAGAYLGSFNSINNTIHSSDPNARMLNRLNYIVPDEGADQTLLQKLSVNLKVKDSYSLGDLKKMPLCYAKDRKGYLVIDYDYSQKKMFRGAFFETCHNTSLTNQPGYSKKDKQTIFNTYNQRSADSFEKDYFKPVIQLFTSQGCDLIYFDDGADNDPDAYIRIGHNVLLLEFKAYVFPEEQSENPDFDKLIKYLDNRFVKSDKGKHKGVGQLVEQIRLFQTDHFKFDPEGARLLKNGELHFYPVIVYNDFNFSMPGINTHLNQCMWELVEDKPELKASMKPLVMLNLETILDIVITGGKAPDLGNLIFMYYNFLLENRAILNIEPTILNLTRSHCSFDEFYRAYIEKSQIENKNMREFLHQLLELSNIDFAEFNTPL